MLTPSILTQDVETEDLIAEVKKYPIVWDIHLEAHSDKAKRKSAWMTIAEQLYEDFEGKNESEKHEISEALAKRWRNLKDCYVKTLRKRSLPPTPSSRKVKQYIYANQLTFLRQSYVEQADSEADPEPPEEDAIGSDVSIEEKPNTESLRRSGRNKSPVPSSTKRSNLNAKKRKHDPELNIPNLSETPLTAVSNQPLPTTQPAYVNNAVHPVQPAHRNQHQSFFDSMVPLLDDFTTEEILDFRMSVLEAIRKIQRARREDEP